MLDQGAAMSKKMKTLLFILGIIFLTVGCGQYKKEIKSVPKTVEMERNSQLEELQANSLDANSTDYEDNKNTAFRFEGDTPTDDNPAATPIDCSTIDTPNGVLITCGEDGVLLRDGTDGYTSLMRVERMTNLDAVLCSSEAGALVKVGLDKDRNGMLDD